MRTNRDVTAIVLGQLLSHLAAFVAGASFLVILVGMWAPTAMPTWALVGWVGVFVFDVAMAKLIAKQTAILVDQSGRIDEWKAHLKPSESTMPVDGEDE